MGSIVFQRINHLVKHFHQLSPSTCCSSQSLTQIDRLSLSHVPLLTVATHSIYNWKASSCLAYEVLVIFDSRPQAHNHRIEWNIISSWFLQQSLHYIWFKSDSVTLSTCCIGYTISNNFTSSRQNDQPRLAIIRWWMRRPASWDVPWILAARRHRWEPGHRHPVELRAERIV